MRRARPLFVLTAVLMMSGFLACGSDPTGPAPSGSDAGSPSPADTTSSPVDTASTPVDTSSSPVDTSGAAPAAFLVCTAQPAAAGSAWIGAGGGEIKVGANEFKVPEGALDSLTFITMEVPSDTIRSVRFGPEGLTFKPGALPELKLDYKGCPKQDHKGKGGDQAKVVYVSENLEILQVLPTADDSLNEDVHANVEHFSRYAISY